MNGDIDNNARIDDLMIRSLDHQTTAEEEEELRVWASQSEENKRYIAEIQYLWRTVTLQDKTSFDSEAAFQRFKAHIAVQRATRSDTLNLKLLFRQAAIFILAVMLGGLGFYIINNYQIRNNTNQVVITVPEGAKTRIILPDKSVVWLNSSSTLRYNQNFGQNGRQLTLTGEGYFEVSKNPKSPFIVHTMQASVEAQGTKFNISAYDRDSQIDITLITGSLRLKTIYQSNAFILKPNQKAIIDKKSKQVIVKNVFADESAGWAKRSFITTSP